MPTKTAPAPTTAETKTADASGQTAEPATQLLELKLTEVEAHPSNLRHVVTGLDELAASIKTHGVLEPPIVAPWPESLKGTAAQKKKWIVIAGHRRLAAAKQAGVKQVSCLVRRDLATEGDQVAAMLIENLHRSDLSPVEEAEGYQAMLDLGGWTQAAIAKATGQKPGRISERLKLTRLTEPVKERLHTGQLTIGDALAIAEFDDDAKTQGKLIEAAGSDRFDWALQSARTERRRAAERAARLQELADADVVVITSNVRPRGWKPVEEIFASAPDRYADGGAAQHRWYLSHHSGGTGKGTCPEAIVMNGTITTYGPEGLHYGCGNPSLHPNAGPKTPKLSAAEQRAADEAKAAREHLQADLTTAAALRHNHLFAVMRTANEDLARPILAREVVEKTYGRYRGDADKKSVLWLAEWSGLTVTADRDQAADLLAQHLTLSALAVLLDLSGHRTTDAHLAEADRFLSSYHGQWLHRLETVYGYKWSDFEAEQFRDLLTDEPQDEATEEDDDEGEPTEGGAALADDEDLDLDVRDEAWDGYSTSTGDHVEDDQ